MSKLPHDSREEIPQSFEHLLYRTNPSSPSESSPKHSFQFLLTHTHGFVDLVRDEISSLFDTTVPSRWFGNHSPSVSIYDYPTTLVGMKFNKPSKYYNNLLLNNTLMTVLNYKEVVYVNFNQLFTFEFLYGYNGFLIMNVESRTEMDYNEFMNYLKMLTCHLNALPSVDNVYSFISIIPNVPLDKKSALPLFCDVIPYRTEDEPIWNQSFDLFEHLYQKQLENYERTCENKEQDVTSEQDGNSTSNITVRKWFNNTSFRVTGIRKQTSIIRHDYSSVEVAAEYGYGVGQHVCKGMKVNLKQYDIDILIYLDIDRAFTAMLLTPPLHRLQSAGLRYFQHNEGSFESLDDIYHYTKRDFRFKVGKSTLKPQTSYMLLKTLLMEYPDLSAKVFGGELVNFVDPFAGSGTLSLAFNYFYIDKNSNVQMYNLDYNDDEIQAMTENSVGHPNIHAMKCDARQIPFKDDMFDMVVTDMPFGVLCGTHSRNSKIYPKLVKHLERIVKPGGVALLLTIEVKLLDAQLYPRNAWDIKTLKASLGELGKGMQATIYLCKRLLK